MAVVIHGVVTAWQRHTARAIATWRCGTARLRRHQHLLAAAAEQWRRNDIVAWGARAGVAELLAGVTTREALSAWLATAMRIGIQTIPLIAADDLTFVLSARETSFAFFVTAVLKSLLTFDFGLGGAARTGDRHAFFAGLTRAVMAGVAAGVFAAARQHLPAHRAASWNGVGAGRARRLQWLLAAAARRHHGRISFTRRATSTVADHRALMVAASLGFSTRFAAVKRFATARKLLRRFVADTRHGHLHVAGGTRTVMAGLHADVGSTAERLPAEVLASGLRVDSTARERVAGASAGTSGR